MSKTLPMTRRLERFILGESWLRAAVFLALAAGSVGPLSADPPPEDKPVAGLPSPVPATPVAPSIFEVLQQQVAKVFDKYRGAVVKVEGSDAHGNLSGSGFFIDPNGMLYTSYAVGGDTHNIVVIMGDRRYPARRVVADNLSGVAVLKVEAQTPFIPIGTAYNLPIATPVMTIGYPMALPLSPSFGIIAGFDRKYLGRYFATTHIRANVPVQCGEGGAPLLNMNGEVIGILISALDAGSASFVLPVEAAEKIRKDYLRFGDVRPGWLGLSVVTAQESVDGSTARVQFVFPNTPAQKAGIEPSDVLLQVGKTKISSPEDMLDACFFLSAQDRITIRVARGNEEVRMELDSADFPGKQAVHQVMGLAPEPLAPPVEKLRLDFRTTEVRSFGPAK
jgi:serine protease Do